MVGTQELFLLLDMNLLDMPSTLSFVTTRSLSHSRAGGNPLNVPRSFPWIPACAGMTDFECHCKKRSNLPLSDQRNTISFIQSKIVTFSQSLLLTMTT
jgi:hypothetical protein